MQNNRQGAGQNARNGQNSQSACASEPPRHAHHPVDHQCKSQSITPVTRLRVDHRRPPFRRCMHRGRGRYQTHRWCFLAAHPRSTRCQRPEWAGAMARDSAMSAKAIKLRHPERGPRQGSNCPAGPCPDVGGRKGRRRTGRQARPVGGWDLRGSECAQPAVLRAPLFRWRGTARKPLICGQNVGARPTPRRQSAKASIETVSEPDISVPTTVRPARAADAVAVRASPRLSIATTIGAPNARTAA